VGTRSFPLRPRRGQPLCGIRQRRPASYAAALSLLLLGVTLSAQDGSPFVAGCPPPYTPEPHPIDNDCGIEGDATTDAKKLENRAKNNLCATGSPVWVTFVSFKKLQEAVEKPGFKLKSDRSGAKNLHTTNPAGDSIGEGTLVTFAAFVLRADTSNKSGGEDVNCTRNGTPSNDIHVHLGPTKTKTPENFCKAVVAELIPHLRPDAFNAGDLAPTSMASSEQSQGRHARDRRLRAPRPARHRQKTLFAELGEAHQQGVPGPTPSCAEPAEVLSRSSPTSPTSRPSHASSTISASVRRRSNSHRRPGSGSLWRWTRKDARSWPAEEATLHGQLRS